MDIKAVFSDIKDKIFSLFEKVKDFCRENKIMSMVIGLLICLIIICLILLGATSKKGNKVEPEEMPLTLTETIINPDGPALPKEYTYSRTTEKNWNEAEIKDWFTIPSEKEIDSLSKANSNLVNEIIGAAP